MAENTEIFFVLCSTPLSMWRGLAVCYVMATRTLVAATVERRTPQERRVAIPLLNVPCAMRLHLVAGRASHAVVLYPDLHRLVEVCEALRRYSDIGTVAAHRGIRPVVAIAAYRVPGRGFEAQSLCRRRIAFMAGVTGASLPVRVAAGCMSIKPSNPNC